MSLFDAAASSDALADWARSVFSTPREQLRHELEALRTRSRDLYYNHAQVRGWYGRLVRNVVGPAGFRLQSDERVERMWRRWCRRDRCSLDGQLSLRGITALVVDHLARDGEAFVRFRFREGDLRLQVLDPELVDLDAYDPRSGTDLGVQVDADGRPVAYHLAPLHPHDRAAVEAEREVLPASQLLHVFRPHFAGQRRGIPWIHAGMVDAQHVRKYRESELVAARVGANKIGFYTDKDGSAGDMGEEAATDGDLPTEASEPGTFHRLPPGVGFEAFDVDRPAGAFEAFEKAVLRGIAASVGASYVSFANDLEGVSYSSIRQGTLDEREMYLEAQQFLIEAFIEPVFDGWLLANRLPPSVEATWLGRGWPWVDPMKEAQAAVLELSHGLTSRTRILAARGTDPETIAAELARERQIFGDSPAPEASPPDPDDTADEESAE